MCNCAPRVCGLFCICCGRQLATTQRSVWCLPPQPVRYIPFIPDLPTPVQTITPWLGRLVLTQ